MATQYIAVRELPDSLQSALRSVGYGRKDIEVKTGTSYSVQGIAGDGERAFTVAVNLDTGQFQTEMGSWGGANMFTRNHVDSDKASRPLPVNGVVIKGHSGGGRPVYAYIVANPAAMTKLLPETTEQELTKEEIKALNIIAGIKGGYRARYFDDHRLGTYGTTNPHLVSLAAKGLVKITGVGVAVTTEGRNVREKNRVMMASVELVKKWASFPVLQDDSSKLGIMWDILNFKTAAQVEEMWVVRNPTKESEWSDIIWRWKDTAQMIPYVIGTGLATWKAEKHAIYTDKNEALKDAKARLKKIWGDSPPPQAQFPANWATLKD